MFEISVPDPRFDPNQPVTINGYMFSPSDALKARARRGDPFTSKDAAAFITPSLRELQIKVLMAAKLFPTGFTDANLCDNLPEIGPSTVRTRRAELVQLGLVQATGIKTKVPGHACGFMVWELTEAGESYPFAPGKFPHGL